jgi:hypothetical protein
MSSEEPAAKAWEVKKDSPNIAVVTVIFIVFISAPSVLSNK